MVIYLLGLVGVGVLAALGTTGFLHVQMRLSPDFVILAAVVSVLGGISGILKMINPKLDLGILPGVLGSIQILLLSWLLTSYFLKAFVP